MGHHPVFGEPFLSENCIISLPRNTIGKTFEIDYSGNSPFSVSNEFKWPIILDKKGNKVNVSKIMKPGVKTSFNIIVGLCVGHDMLFTMNSKAPVTTLIVKDRFTGHNPVISLYTKYHRNIV